MKKMMLVVSLICLFLPTICYGDDTKESSFDASSDLTSRYARRQILNGKTTSIEKKEEEVYLEFPFDNSPYMSFSNFIVDGPTHVYSGFIETIYYRDKIKVKAMYYENNPVKTDKIGIYSTDLCFTSEEGVIYHYKNVPYLVSSEKPTVFFSELNFNKEDKTITGEIKMPASKNTYKIELFYTDNDEYHYQEDTVDKNGKFSIALNREAIEGKMYLRASDGLGNYADACDVIKQGSTSYPVPQEALKSIQESHRMIKSTEDNLGWFVRIFTRAFSVIVFILTLLRLRVLLRRRKRRKRMNLLKKNRY